MNIQKRILIFLLCGTVAVSLVILVVLVYQKARREPMEYFEDHKNTWIDLLTNNNEVLPYLEQLYTIEGELIINYRNGELTTNELASNMFSPQELEKLEEFFKKFQWETIRLRKQTNAEQKVLEVISTQMKFGKYFRKYFCTAVIVYSPNDELDIEEEIFPNWYYKMYFET